jgi:hypothetical protein
MSSAIFACLKNGRIEVNKVCEILQKAYGESAMKKTTNKCLLVV